MDTQAKHHVIHYMEKLEKETRDEKVMRYLRKLHEVPITIDILMGTGVGKVVNRLKKNEGDVGKYAQKLVLLWKEVVSKQRSEEKRTVKNSDSENPYLSLKTAEANSPSGYSPSNSSQDYKKFKSQPKSQGPEKSSNCDKTHPNSSNKIKDSKKHKKSKRSHSNKEKSSAKPSKRKHDIREKIKDKDNLDNQTASFEDALGFNDIIPLKKTRTHSPNAPSVQHKDKSVSKMISDKVDGEGSSFKNKSYMSVGSEDERPVFDMSLTLSKIQPNYKPTPRYELPVPSYCVTTTPGAQHFVDDSMFSSSKAGRTKLYSGRASHSEPRVFSLQQLCLRTLSENIDDIGPMGNVPYFIIKPVLENCTAHQLFQIEYDNPYLLEDSDELWQVLCTKDFRNRAPDEMESWREMYLRLSDERERKLKSITANISASMAKATPVRQTKLAYVDTVAKPPRDVARAQAKKGTGLPVGLAMKAGPSSIRTPRAKAPAINTASSSNSSNHAAQKKKSMAPLMQKSLNFMKNRFRR